MSLFFTSDLHFYHTNVIKYCNRPYSSVEEMNEKLVSNWNEIVKPEDEIYCLGDFSMAFRPVETFTPRLNGKKYLVPGNHDFCHSVHKKSKNEPNHIKWILEYEKHGWTVLPEQITMLLDKTLNVQVCHLPFSGDHTNEERYTEKRPVNDGRWLLCGHVHNHWKVKDKMINVGVDVWDYKPVSVDVIKEIICSNT